MPRRQFEIIAHRGSSREFPENTLESFARAVELYDDVILELDLWMSKDREIVVMHDGVLEKTTSGTGPLDRVTLQSIKEVEAGHNISFDGGATFPFRGRGFRPATLGEVLTMFPRSRISADIKYDSPDFARQVVRCLEEYDALDRVIVGSFHDRIVSLVRRECPLAATSFSRGEVLRFVFMQKAGLLSLGHFRGDALMVPEFSSGEKPEDLGPGVFQGFRVVTPAFIEAARSLGLPVFVWTVNRRENMDRLISWGVDGIISDYPERLLEAAGHLFRGGNKIH